MSGLMDQLNKKKAQSMAQTGGNIKVGTDTTKLARARSGSRSPRNAASLTQSVLTRVVMLGFFGSFSQQAAHRRGR